MHNDEGTYFSSRALLLLYRSPTNFKCRDVSTFRKLYEIIQFISYDSDGQ